MFSPFSDRRCIKHIGGFLQKLEKQGWKLSLQVTDVTHSPWRACFKVQGVVMLFLMLGTPFRII